MQALWQTQETIRKLDETEHTLKERESSLAKTRRQLREEEEETARLSAMVAEQETTIRRLTGELASIQGSIGYRSSSDSGVIGPPVRWLAPAGTRRRAGHPSPFRPGMNVASSRGGRRTTPKAGTGVGMAELLRNFPRHPHQPGCRFALPGLAAAHAITDAKARRIQTAAAKLTYRPKISIIVPVYNPEPNWLRDSLESVRGQLYDNWELLYRR